MAAVLDEQKRGYFFHRHDGGHSSACFVELNWMWSFRRNRSFLAFTNRVGYGIETDGVVSPGGGCANY